MVKKKGLTEKRILLQYDYIVIKFFSHQDKFS